MYIKMIAANSITTPIRITSNTPRLRMLTAIPLQSDKLSLELRIASLFKQSVISHTCFEIIDLAPVNERNLELFKQ